MEADSTISPLGLWKLISDGDENYIENASGGAQLEYNGNAAAGGPAGTPLEYTFICPKDGVYRLTIRCRKRLDGEKNDKCNDGYVRMTGNFQSNNDIPVADLQKDEKFFGGNSMDWGWANLLDWKGHIKKGAEYKMKKGEIYTLTISGRSQRWNMDYIVLFDRNSYTIDDAHSYIIPGAIPYGCVNLNADEFEISKGKKTAVAYMDTQRNAMAINATKKESRNNWASASIKYDGESGIYTFGLVTMLEKDGESKYRIKVDKEYISEVLVNSETTKDYTSQLHEVTKPILVKKGDIIIVEFLAVTNGKIPENDGTAYSRGRWTELRLYGDQCKTTLPTDIAIQQ
jgi:hypothetical protein